MLPNRLANLNTTSSVRLIAKKIHNRIESTEMVRTRNSPPKINVYISNVTFKAMAENMLQASLRLDQNLHFWKNFCQYIALHYAPHSTTQAMTARGLLKESKNYILPMSVFFDNFFLQCYPRICYDDDSIKH